MTSSDGFYSPPFWQTPDTSNVPSRRASVSSGNEKTGQSQTGAPHVDNRSSWFQVQAETCSEEESVTYNRPVTSPPHAYIQLTEGVPSQTQGRLSDPPFDVPGSPSFLQKHNLTPYTTSSNKNPVEFQDGHASERVPRTLDAKRMFSLYPVQVGGLMLQPCPVSGQFTKTSETLAGHGSVEEHGQSVLCLHDSGPGGESVQPVPNDDLMSDTVEDNYQDPVSTSTGTVENVCLQLTKSVICHTLDLHTASAVSCVSSNGPNAPVQLPEGLASNRAPRTHCADETFSLDPVVAARLSAQSPLGPRNQTQPSEALVAHNCVGRHGKTALLLSEMDADREVVQPVPDEVSAVDFVEENCQDPLSTSAAEPPSKVTVQNVFSQLTGAVVCHTHAFDTHTTSALGVCGSPSPSPEYNSGPVCSDDALVELEDGITSKTAHITHTADMTLGLDPVMAGDIGVASETLAGAVCAVEHVESSVLISDVDTEVGEAIQLIPDNVTEADSVKENRCQDCLFTSADAMQDVDQSQIMGSLSPSTLEGEFKQLPSLSNPANSNEACPGSESLAKCVTQTDSLVAADATDASAKEKQSWTGCCDTQLQNNHQHSQMTADPSEPAGLPYSLRRRRRGALTSSSADSSSAPVSAKRSCLGQVQSCSSSFSPVEGCSQGAPAPLNVPVKRKRGRPRKIQQPVHLNEVSSIASVPAGKADSKSTVCESTVTEDCLEETPDTSLSTKRCLRRKAASAVSGESESQGNNKSPLDLPLTLSADAQQSQLSQEPELLAAPCSDLSFEQILQDDPMPLTPLSLPEEEDGEDEDPEEEEEELPSILERKPLSITEGLCVWCKFRKYPFWPAVVKSVNHKNKKASIVFIDTFLIDEKGIRKGLTVSLKTLKPLDCEDAEELTKQARQQYGDAITWCLELIYDYRIRIGCGSFSGSFIEYFASDISCPLRQKYSQGTSDLTFPTQLIVDDLCDSSEEDGVGEQVDGQQCKKLLPDRAKAARTRANEKLVDFIVRKRGAEKRLLAVISGQETSKWLRALQKASRFVVDPYLEDEEQVDQVYRYLDELLRKSPQMLPCLANLERIPFILDVLLPEALICAIAGVDDISLEQAEEKYRKGPCISKRERQEFNMRIEQLMKTLNQCKQVL